jgi:hypothetical protein
MGIFLPWTAAPMAGARDATAWLPLRSRKQTASGGSRQGTDTDGDIRHGCLFALGA